MSKPLRWYLLSIASVLLPGGISMVVFPSLVAIYLGASPERLGIAQMAGQLPSLVLVLLGGVVGDRFDQKRILIAAHVLAALPSATLALAIALDAMTYRLLVGYAFALGVVGAIAQPSRDALLSRVAGADVQRTVTVVMALQFVAQIVGFGVGSLTSVVGPALVLAVHAAAMSAGAIAVSRIALAPVDGVQRSPRQPPARRKALREIGDALRTVVDSQRLLPVMVVNTGISVFFGGTFVVLIPLQIRDVYGGGPGAIAFAFLANMVGTVAMMTFLVARGGIAHQGRALVLALLSGSLVLLPMCFGVAASTFFALIFCWGLGAGVAMSMVRTIAQEAAPATHRARVMSVLSLGGMGGSAIGSLAMGYAAAAVGPGHATWLAVVGMAVLTTAVVLASGIWRLMPIASSETV